MFSAKNICLSVGMYIVHNAAQYSRKKNLFLPVKSVY